MEPSHLHQAEEHLEAERFQEAIKEYEAHMNDRLTLTNRPDWENPYFYLLAIGDAHCKEGDPNAALKSYQKAEKRFHAQFGR